MPRSRLGPLAIESKLGDHPSTSSVWRAIHVKHKKAVAVKVFSAPFGGTPEARQLFSAEWERLKTVQHAGIAKCYGGGFEETDAYLAYELVEGPTFASEIDRLGRMPWENALDAAQTLIDALEYLHAGGIVHGAIVPEKIIINGLSPVLLDLRVDRFASPFRSSRPPTADFLARQAPELVTPLAPGDADAASPASDLYSLGALLYHAITGRPVITGETLEAVRRNVPLQTPESVGSLVLDCPVWFDRLIMRMLEKDPAQRPPNAAAVRLALAEVRKRSLSRAGVAEHVSSGFSALQVTTQADKDEARTLLGRGVVDLQAVEDDDQDEAPDATVWHDQPWFLLGGLALLLMLLAWVAWPASEATLRKRAEALLAQDTRSAWAQAERQPLRELMVRFPDGPNAEWARQQVDRINVRQFLHQLSVKIRKNLPITDEGELLHKRAQQYAENGNLAEAIEKYESMITVLGDEPEYKTAVDAARHQIGVLEQQQRIGDDDAAQIIRTRLAEAEEKVTAGEVAGARDIWYSLVELYGDRSELAALIDQARQRLAETE